MEAEKIALTKQIIQLEVDKSWGAMQKLLYAASRAKQ